MLIYPTANLAPFLLMLQSASVSLVDEGSCTLSPKSHITTVANFLSYQ